jgi:flagellar biosynthesis/type III secretory pathway protein FliH
VIFRRSRFDDLVRRQLEAFAEDESELLEEAREAEHAYDSAGKEDAEEAYSEFQLVLEAGGERLEAIRDAYAATLDEETGEAYAEAFARAARRRYPKLAGEL